MEDRLKLAAQAKLLSTGVTNVINAINDYIKDKIIRTDDRLSSIINNFNPQVYTPQEVKSTNLLKNANLLNDGAIIKMKYADVNNNSVDAGLGIKVGHYIIPIELIRPTSATYEPEAKKTIEDEFKKANATALSISKTELDKLLAKATISPDKKTRKTKPDFVDLLVAKYIKGIMEDNTIVENETLRFTSSAAIQTFDITRSDVDSYMEGFRDFAKNSGTGAAFVNSMKAEDSTIEEEADIFLPINIVDAEKDNFTNLLLKTGDKIATNSANDIKEMIEQNFGEDYNTLVRLANIAKMLKKYNDSNWSANEEEFKAKFPDTFATSKSYTIDPMDMQQWLLSMGVTEEEIQEKFTAKYLIENKKFKSASPIEGALRENLTALLNKGATLEAVAKGESAVLSELKKENIMVKFRLPAIDLTKVDSKETMNILEQLGNLEAQVSKYRQIPDNQTISEQETVTMQAPTVPGTFNRPTM